MSLMKYGLTQGNTKLCQLVSVSKTIVRASKYCLHMNLDEHSIFSQMTGKFGFSYVADVILENSEIVLQTLQIIDQFPINIRVNIQKKKIQLNSLNEAQSLKEAINDGSIFLCGNFTHKQFSYVDSSRPQTAAECKCDTASNAFQQSIPPGSGHCCNIYGAYLHEQGNSVYMFLRTEDAYLRDMRFDVFCSFLVVSVSLIGPCRGSLKYVVPSQSSSDSVKIIPSAFQCFFRSDMARQYLKIILENCPHEWKLPFRQEYHNQWKPDQQNGLIRSVFQDITFSLEVHLILLQYYCYFITENTRLNNKYLVTEKEIFCDKKSPLGSFFNKNRICDISFGKIQSEMKPIKCMIQVKSKMENTFKQLQPIVKTATLLGILTNGYLSDTIDPSLHMIDAILPGWSALVSDMMAIKQAGPTNVDNKLIKHNRKSIRLFEEYGVVPYDMKHQIKPYSLPSWNVASEEKANNGGNNNKNTNHKENAMFHPVGSQSNVSSCFYGHGSVSHNNGNNVYNHQAFVMQRDVIQSVWPNSI
eukprot:19788_1